jgi:gamma-carbonic anhydrase
MDPDEVPHHFHAEPRIASSAFFASNAIVLGDVEIGRDVSIWYGAVLRGDVQAIRIGDGSNIQDGTIVHASTGGLPTLVGRSCTVGHGAILHSCTLQDHAFVGFGARVLDGCTVESDGALAAGAVLTPGKTVRSGELWAGNPARLLRLLQLEEIARQRAIALRYVALASAYRNRTVAS